MRSVRIMVKVLSLAVLITVQAYSRQEVTSLKGIKSVRVTIGYSNEIDGISSFQLSNDIELKLRQVGIKIDPESDAELKVTVVIMDLDPKKEHHISGLYGTVELGLEQTVQLLREQPSFVRATTWTSGVTYLHGPPSDFGQRCREFARDLTDYFMNAYLSANTK